MAGYLDQYGEGDEQRAKILKRTLFGILAAIVLIALPWYETDCITRWLVRASTPGSRGLQSN